MVLSETSLGASVGALLQVLLDRIIPALNLWDVLKPREFDTQLLPRLNLALLAVNSVLSDAEVKQVSNLSVKRWLDEVKDAVYDTEDLLDEIETEEMQSKSEHTPWNIFRLRIESEIKTIIDRLEAIAKQKDLLDLKEGVAAAKPSPRLPATSLVDESEVFGRNDEKETIVDFLLSDNMRNEIGIPTVAIVGMPGIGKTTLAQLLFNDKRVMKSFDITSWAFVSEALDVIKVTKTIYESLASRECNNNTSDLNILQVRLQEELVGKKFLLVLDDVWSENFADWEVLTKPFKAAAAGSRIIVTTRNGNVASIVCAALTHVVPPLSAKDCWLLFARYAFRNGKSQEFPELKETGEMIVRKCNGVPLAAKTLGSLLQNKDEIGEWVDILNSKIWDLPIDKSNLLPALRLSYYYLPSHIKRCFAYCSILPKGYKIEKKKIILLWMAEGLVLQSRSKKRPEDVGEEYFQELLSRSFFQQSSCGGNKPSFTMHDLFNDLAQSVAGEFCFKFEDGNTQKVTEKVRHFSYLTCSHDAYEKFDAFWDAHRLRTFLPLTMATPIATRLLCPTVLNNLLQKSKRLRVLSLSPYIITDSKFKTDSLGSLRHLRYLDLSHTLIESLPESVSSLYNLETLLLVHCRKLTQLPESIDHLKHLRYLDLSESGIQNLPESAGSLDNLETLLLLRCQGLNNLPESLGNLKQLRFLDLSRSAIQHLPESFGFLHNLETLFLRDCHHLTTLPETMQELTKLRYLDIHGTMLEKMPPDIGSLRGLQLLTDFVIGNGGSAISELKELSNLRGKLSISGLQNVNDATDASAASLKAKKHLYKLVLRWKADNHDEQNETLVLDKLQPHENLEELTIEGYGGTSFPLWLRDASISNIVSLCLNDCQNCDIWPSLGELYSLQKLRIIKCPKLTDDLPNHLPSLRSLRVCECGYMIEPDLPNRRNGHNSYFRLDCFTKLEDLHIEKWNGLKILDVSSSEDLMSLQRLHISDCPNLEFSSGKKWRAPNLEFLSLLKCSSVRSMPAQMTNLTSLQELEICECPELVSIPEGGLPASLKSLSITNCNMLTPQLDWGLHAMSALDSFKIQGGCSGMNIFPADGLLPATLASVHISCLQDLEKLNFQGLQQLNRLEFLTIESCDKLERKDEIEDMLPESVLLRTNFF